MVLLPPDALQTDILGPLTPSQREAVQHGEGPLLILAGPGSGKTRVITHRIAYLLYRGVPARRILALTFTNKAADEMRIRLDRLAPRQPVWLGTFHRFCARLLRRHAALVGLKENFSIYDTHDSVQVVKAALDDAGAELTYTPPRAVAAAISWAKSELVSADEYCPRPGSTIGWLVQQVYPAYQRRLLEANAADFDDLLLHVATLLSEHEALRQALDARYQYILVDEYQDTNRAQYTIARALARDCPNLAVAGDPDQSIYGWRGANLNNILDFEQDFDHVRVVRLEKNYRSTPGILRVADQLIANNVRRKHKALFTDRPEGAPVRLVIYRTAEEEAEAIAAQIGQQVSSGARRLRDFAIFYRVNALSRLLENALRKFKLPYQVVKGLEFYQRKEIKDVLAYLHLLNNPSNNVALCRIINTPPRKIGKKTMERLAQHAERYRLSLLDAAREVELIQTLTKPAASALKQFVAMYDRWRAKATGRVEEIVRQVLAESGYWRWLEASDTPEDHERLENLGELVSDARQFDEQHEAEAGLEAYLEQRSLIADVDTWETQTDRVTLMTLHAAKGLEFPVVFIVGLEEKLLPYKRPREEPDDEEEERRLLFVGITRAEDELQLSYAQSRTRAGKRQGAVPSSFLMELPREQMEVVLPDPSFDGDGSAKQPAGDARAWEEAEWVQDDPTGVSFDGPAAYPPRLFKYGMPVDHPDYGSGRIVSVRGTGRNRSATVRFCDGQEKTFRLSHAPLTPSFPVD